MIDNASVEQLKSQIDIVDIISNYIEVKKAGANFKANCPFHGEKTPSFVISPVKQIYHCFGCGIGGDAIKFVQEYEKLNYPEALEKIASMMNFSLTYTQGVSDNNDARRVLEQVQAWYSKNLDANRIALEYLRNRGITQQSIETFGIGYVGASNTLMNFLSQNMLTIPKAEEAGVVAKRDRGGFYARLTERI
ncbi:MAG TPA: DNA primase, partial [Campylobacterales bacterium]|nr:DNA primase [Campylobacterales bacterium]